MKKRLTDIQRANTLCGIYSDFESTTKFAAGYIRACNDDYTVIELFDPYGHYDGIACFLTDIIFNVETKTKYLSSLNKLIKHYNEKSCYSPDMIGDINRVLALVKNERRVCEIELCESHNVDVSGVVLDFDDEIIKVLNIDDDGREDGESTVSRRSVSKLSFDSTDTIKTEILYN